MRRLVAAALCLLALAAFAGDGGFDSGGGAASTPAASYPLMAELSWGPGAIAPNSCTSNTVNLPGARLSTDVLTVGPPALPSGISVFGAISAADTAKITVCNPTNTTSTSISTSNWLVRTAP